MNMNPITHAMQVAGSGPKLAGLLGISARAVYKWEARWNSGRVDAVPPGRAIEIEGLIGVPRAELRPDLWADCPSPREAA